MSVVRQEQGLENPSRRAFLIHSLEGAAATVAAASVVAGDKEVYQEIYRRVVQPLWHQYQDTQEEFRTTNDFLAAYREPLSHFNFTYNFSPTYYRSLAPDRSPAEAIPILKNEFQAGGVRIPIPWNRCQPTVNPRSISLSEILPVLDQCVLFNIPTTLTIGDNTTRWPEVHYPDWLMPQVQALVSGNKHPVITAQSSVAHYMQEFLQAACDRLVQEFGDAPFIKRVQAINEVREGHGDPSLQYEPQYVANQYRILLSHFPGRRIGVNTGCFALGTSPGFPGEYTDEEQQSASFSFGRAARLLLWLKEQFPGIGADLYLDVYEEMQQLPIVYDMPNLPIVGRPDTITGMEIFQEYVTGIMNNLEKAGAEIGIEELQTERWGDALRADPPGSVEFLKKMISRLMRGVLPHALRLNKQGMMNVGIFGSEQKIVQGIEALRHDPTVQLLRAVNERNFLQVA